MKLNRESNLQIVAEPNKQNTFPISNPSTRLLAFSGRLSLHVVGGLGNVDPRSGM
jgi:hypothetical protein